MKIESNFLKFLPDILFSTLRLKYLSVSNNLISVLPDSIILLKNSLEYLDLSINRIEILNDKIGWLENL